jgi:Fic family protein
MARSTGTYRQITVGGERAQAFIPHPLPPSEPPLVIEDRLAELHADAVAALGRLEVAGAMVPSVDWFLYGFIRKEAVVSSQIEGTQATLMDVVTYEATHETDRPADVEEVCNYVDALSFARGEMSAPDGLPISARLLCGAHERLMRGSRGAGRQAGRLRTQQNWIGGGTPGLATFIPPPPDAVPDALGALERWIHGDGPLPPLVRAGLAHVQFETIHPFLDGNGRIGRLLIALLLEHWGVLSVPLLYLSLALKRRRLEYYDRLDAVRRDGDWEGWTAFFLESVREAAEDGVDAARRLFAVLGRDRPEVVGSPDATVTSIRLYDVLPQHPIITLSLATGLLEMSKPTAAKAIAALTQAGILREITGRRRDRAYAYDAYLKVLSEDTALAP